jgi:hypothetical protein
MANLIFSATPSNTTHSNGCRNALKFTYELAGFNKIFRGCILKETELMEVLRVQERAGVAIKAQ